MDKKSVEGDLPVRLCNYTDVYYRDVIRPDQQFMEATASREQVRAFQLRASDVVITKDSETAEDIGVPAYVEMSEPDLVCGYHLAVVRPTTGVLDGRFLFWSMTSAAVREQLTVAATGVTRYGLRTDSISGTIVPLPRLSQQRAIADFLDAETGRIDRLGGKQRRMADLLVERLRSMVDHRTGIGEPTRVRHITSLITSGPRGWGERVGDVGVPFIRSQNLRRDGMALRPEGLGRVWDEATPEAKRSRVHADDTVIGITGANTGWVGAVTAPFADGYVSQHVAILRPRAIDPRWLTYSLFSRRAQEQLLAGQYGGTKQQLGLSDLAELTVFVPELETQQRIIRELDRAVVVQGRLDEALSLQNSLLEERRQAIITAAVSGELKVA